MISKNRAAFINSLQKKRVREEERLYVIEGDKLVREFLAAGVRLRLLVAKREFMGSLAPALRERIDETEEVTYDELKKVSSLRTPHNALALVPMPEWSLDTGELFSGICVALDLVQDPGNLGTIIRAASWFGIQNIVCSNDCVDVYNPKVVQASMGALLHVRVFYTDLRQVIVAARENELPVYGTLLDGESIYDQNLSGKGLILLGNESRGISDDLRKYVTHRILIPGPVAAGPGIESLNVGIAAAVVFSEFMRQTAHIGNK
jgi:TrmH family RNA methyltransferase